ncbi:MAG: hypothetical protein K2M47_01590 [Clostridiales bacterium]|nr:hypothetical protein [Clostridiales bacterium]
MANYKDNNADIGNQTIEGTVSPYELDAEIVMPDESNGSIPQAENADEQPVIILAEPIDPPADQPIITPEPQVEPIIMAEPQAETIVMPAADTADDLDAQLAAMLDDQPAENTEQQPDVNANANADDLDAQLAAMLGDQNEQPAEQPAEQTENIANLDEQLAAMLGEQDEQPTTTNETADDLDAQLAAMLGDQNEQPAEQPAAQDEQPVIVTPEQPAQQAEQPQSDDAARAMLEQAQAIMEQAKQAQKQAEAQMQAAMIQEQARQAVQAAQAAQAAQRQTQQQPAQQPSDNATEAARAMIQQAQMMMQQAQAAQLQAQQAAQAAQLHAQQAAQPLTRTAGTETEAARIMMEQAKRLMEQAQAAQMQATQAAQIRNAATYGTDPYALKEVDRLKNELDGMRELVNKLTLAMSQSANAGAQGAAQQQYGYNPDRDQYRRLETELDKMRRDIIEKDLRDREKELDRRQKEAETVRDIRPEMMQMSDSREVAPIAPPQQNVGNEYIPIANGVYYSTKDKQVYVMTPASGAASANPTIERPKAAAPKRPAARPRPARPSARRRPGGPMRRRPSGPRRPHR